MTKDSLDVMTVKGLELFLNGCVANISHTSTERSSVRREMFEKVQQIFGPEFNLRNSDYHYQRFSIPTKKLNLEITIGTKTTGDIKDVSRLRKKYVVGIGKFKVDSITFSHSMPFFKVEDEKNFLVEIDSQSTRNGHRVYLPKSKMSFLEMSQPQYLLEQIEGLYKEVEKRNAENTRWGRQDRVERVYKNFIEEIALDAAQPFIKPAWMGNEKKLIKRLPKAYQEQIKHGFIDWFEATIKVVAENNAELINNVQTKILS
jgi:hypothetical protein